MIGDEGGLCIRNVGQGVATVVRVSRESAGGRRHGAFIAVLGPGETKRVSDLRWSKDIRRETNAAPWDSTFNDPVPITTYFFTVEWQDEDGVTRQTSCKAFIGR